MEAASLETAKLLGSGSVQLVLAVICVALAGAAVWLGRTLFSEMKACHASSVAQLTQKIESDNKLSDAIEASTRVAEAMLAQLRKP